jgi:hypothetical protein
MKVLIVSVALIAFVFSCCCCCGTGDPSMWSDPDYWEDYMDDYFNEFRVPDAPLQMLHLFEASVAELVQ